MKFRTLVLIEPYRLFFPLGWLMGLLGSSYWLIVSIGLIDSYAPLYHGLIQIELFCAAFAVGFLLTALPKFLRTRTASSGEVACLLASFLLLAVSTLSNQLVIGQWSFIVLILLFVRFAAIRIKERRSSPPFSFLLVGFGILQGILGALLVLYPSAHFPLLGQKFVEQGMFLSLSLGVGCFLGPRLMGVVDIENAIVSLPGRISNSMPFYRSPAFKVCGIGLLILASFLIETGWNRAFGLSLRAAATVICLAHFGALKVPRRRSVAGVFAAIALWTIALGILASVLLPSHEAGALHLTYIGGFGLLILTIGAQVTTSHGGVHNFWQIHKRGTVFTLSLATVSAFLRAGATFFPAQYFLLIGLAALLFDVSLVCWGIGVLRYIGIKNKSDQPA